MKSSNARNRAAKASEGSKKMHHLPLKRVTLLSEQDHQYPVVFFGQLAACCAKHEGFSGVRSSVAPAALTLARKTGSAVSALAMLFSNIFVPVPMHTHSFAFELPGAGERQKHWFFSNPRTSLERP
jgi:hypothetical protein